MTGVLVLLAAAVARWRDPGRRVRLRLQPLGCRRDAARRRPGPVRVEGPLRRWLVAAGAAVPIGVLLGGALGLGVAVAVLLLAERGLRRVHDRRASDAHLLRELPVACDLLAVCVAAG